MPFTHKGTSPFWENHTNDLLLPFKRVHWLWKQTQQGPVHSPPDVPTAAMSHVLLLLKEDTGPGERGVVRDRREVTFPPAFHEGWKQVPAWRPQNPPHLAPEQRRRPRGAKVGWHSCSCWWAWRGPSPLLSGRVWADLCRHGGGIAWDTRHLCFTYSFTTEPFSAPANPEGPLKAGLCHSPLYEFPLCF